MFRSAVKENRLTEILKQFKEDSRQRPLYSGFLNPEIGITPIFFSRALHETNRMISVDAISNDEALVTLSKNVSPEQAEEAFKEVLRAPHHKVTIDCSDLNHMGHEILGKLYMLNMDLQINRRSLVLAGCSEKIRNLLHLTKIDERIKIENDSSSGRRFRPLEP